LDSAVDHGRGGETVFLWDATAPVSEVPVTNMDADVLRMKESILHSLVNGGAHGRGRLVVFDSDCGTDILVGKFFKRLGPSHVPRDISPRRAVIGIVLVRLSRGVN
jgi:hypothetical protein